MLVLTFYTAYGIINGENVEGGFFMDRTPTFNELLECINSGKDQRKANCSVGFFISEYSCGAEDSAQSGRDVDNFIVRKPIVSISSFLESNELFYDVRFQFRSFNDADYKQMWKLICRFAEKTKREAECLNAGEVLDKVTALAVSIVPEIYRGKYFLLVNMPFSELISRSENAFDGTAEISLICDEESLGALMADDDVIDRRYIEAEAEDEIIAEMGFAQQN